MRASSVSKYSAKIRYIEMQHFDCCLVRKWGITIEALVPRSHITQENYELDF